MNRVEIKDLNIIFPLRNKTIHAVKDVTFSIKAGQIFGIVGESGAGKSTIGNAIIGFLEPPGELISGDITLDGVKINKNNIKSLRGSKIGMIFQDPMTSLNPLLTIGEQLIETIRRHREFTIKESREYAIQLLNRVGINKPIIRMNEYPHQFSGGMRQRVVIALALCGNPSLIVADEPTTALDVSIQSQILKLLQSLCHKEKISILLITHNMGVISEICDSVAVMKFGEFLETGDTYNILVNPQMDYSRNLISSVPRIDKKLDRISVPGYKLQNFNSKIFSNISAPNESNISSEILMLKNVVMQFHKSNFNNKNSTLAVNDVSFSIKNGEIMGLVGESGSGKTTIAKIITNIHIPTSGQIYLFGKNILEINNYEKKSIKKHIQMIFQDPYSSLNPRMKIKHIISEPIKFHNPSIKKNETKFIINELLVRVELNNDCLERYPHEFSGGQRQRISIARALATNPKLLICDEPTSSLDVSIQAQILNLLKDLQNEFNLSILFISHDLPVIRQMCDRIGVMYQGKLIELDKNDHIFNMPKQSYTKSLINQIPDTKYFYNSYKI